MLERYPATCGGMGEHRIRVTLLDGDYRGSVVVRVGGNARGMAVMNDVADTMLCDGCVVESDCQFTADDEGYWELVLKDKDGDTCFFDGGGTSDLEDMIVAVEIISYDPDEEDE